MSCRHSPRIHPLRLAAAALAFPLAGCGTAAVDEPSTETQSARISQSTLKADQWAALLSGDAQLTALEKAQKQPWLVAGSVVAADGGTFIWAEYAQDALVPRDQVAAVMRQCPKAAAGETPTCVYFKGQYTATGVTVTTAAGVPVQALPVAPPTAWEWTGTTNLDADNTTLVAALSSESDFIVDPDVVGRAWSAVHSNKRRLVVVSPYGRQVGVDLTPIAAAVGPGLFDSVETIEFVRRSDLESLLPSLTIADTFVWVGAGVQPRVSKTAAPLAPKGMNVSRGVAGDEVYYGKIAKNLLDMPPFGGPGLIILAGQNAVLAEANPGKDTLAGVWHDGFSRTVVGIQMRKEDALIGNTYVTLPLNDVIAATGDLLGGLSQGKSLESAMADQPARGGLTWTSPMGLENRKLWRWPKPAATFWSQKPGTGTLTLRFSLVPQCKAKVAQCDIAGWQAVTKIIQTENKPVTVVCSNPSFVGPYFTCAGGDSQPPGTKFDVSGVVQGTNKGDRILFVADADDAGPMAGALVLGNGVIQDTSDVSGGSSSYKFDGTGAVSTYIDSNGYCCTSLNPIQLIGNTASDLSVLKLQN